jgi:adenine-specific DNA-methyltransferase
MMVPNQLKLKKSLNKAYLKVKPSRSEIEVFKTNLMHLMDQSNDTESEEFHKNLIADFLKKTYYDPNHSINTKGRNDLVIHNGKDAKTTVGVILEAKKPTNKAEMLRKDKLNTKAFQELVLYYLRERVTHKNLEIKYLIATNIYEWFVFDANVFEKCFAQNKKFVKQFEDFEAGSLVGKTTDFFYKDIAEPFIAAMDATIEFTHFDLREYDTALRNADEKDDKKLVSLLKVLSPEHLLKLPFANDSNSLDKKFYGELLHIIGLTETKDGGKKVIQRNKIGERYSGALLENAVIQLDALDKISRLDKPSQYGDTNEDRMFNVGLELSITWVNRILFLKLLEAQMIAYHKGDPSYAFLNFKKINNYDDLNSLFFQVLAKKHHERNFDEKDDFVKVPYLNSSLFEPSDLEHDTLFISNLRDEKKLPILSSTVLKDENGKKRTGELTALQYFFEFLDAYDFSSEGGEDIQEDNKTLINASVLGLIFEKINGYKDGSFFTPGFITMYMCRETIRRAVVQKFNDTKGWKCNDLHDLYDKIEDRKEANAIVNSLKICDPAVGSGHFLVSALNEMIAVKNDLKILQDRDGKRLKEYHFEVVNDELVVTDDDGEPFVYTPTNKEAQRVQETLFHEKQTIIENCLFGVDINPNSVKICRLRLWIELLKNAYYKSETELETLPNIDINIKCGNSLISRFDLNANIKDALKRSKWSIDSYRIAVATYRDAKSKDVKHSMLRLINDIKGDFRSEVSLRDPKIARLSKLNGELMTHTNQTSLFAMSDKEKKEWNQKLEALLAAIKKQEAEIEEIKNNKIYENAFEWRFEFPEVLNDQGDFEGFDVVIGNPPYGVKPNDLEQSYFKQKFLANDDIYTRFFERGAMLLGNSGFLNFITPIFWLNGDNYKNTRTFVKNECTFNLGIILPYDVFEDAYVDTGIFEFAKGHSGVAARVYEFDLKNEVSFEILQRIAYVPLEIRDWQASEMLSIVFNPFWRGLKSKIYLEKSIGDYTTSFRGILADKEDYSNTKQSPDFVEVFTQSFNRYESQFTELSYVDYRRIKEGPKNAKEFEGQKIFVRRIVNRQLRIMATITDKSFAVKKDIYLFFPIEKSFANALLAIINSKLVSFLLTKGSSSARKDDFTQITLGDIRNIGVPNINEGANSSISALVTQILTLKKANPEADTTALEAEIDQLVYALYGLTAEEIALVETSVK